jgi:hypothetical protein
LVRDSRGQRGLTEGYLSLFRLSRQICGREEDGKVKGGGGTPVGTVQCTVHSQVKGERGKYGYDLKLLVVFKWDIGLLDHLASSNNIQYLLHIDHSPESGARIYRPIFGVNKPKTAIENECFGLVFAKTRSINSGTGILSGMDL